MGVSFKVEKEHGESQLSGDQSAVLCTVVWRVNKLKAGRQEIFLREG